MTEGFRTVRAAAVHAASPFLDLTAGVAKASRLIAEAGKAGAELIVFPETFLPGYPFWIWTHTPATSGALFLDLVLNSVELGDSATQALGDAARAAGATVVIGVSERDGGTLYNTLLYFGPDGQLIGRHRKLQPTVVERTIWGRGDGADLRIVDSPVGRVGGLICWEHSMDLARYALTSQGEQIHVAAWPAISALSHDPSSGIFDALTEAAARHHAAAGQCFVINAQGCIDAPTIERLGLVGRDEMIRAGGGWSAIIGPSGRIITGPHRDQETILYGDLDFAEIAQFKYVSDSAGHYARPDVLGLRVDYRSQTGSASFPGQRDASPAFTEPKLQSRMPMNE